MYNGVRVIASRVLHEIRLRTNLTLIVRLGFKSDLLIGETVYAIANIFRNTYILLFLRLLRPPKP